MTYLNTNNNENLGSPVLNLFGVGSNVENGDFGNVQEGFQVRLARGSDEVDGTAIAISDEGQAFADDILNTGNIGLQNGADRVEGSANATTAANGETTIATGINSTDGGRLRGNGGRDLFQGEATAEGQDNVGAFATLFSTKQRAITIASSIAWQAP